MSGAALFDSDEESEAVREAAFWDETGDCLQV
jgi:hypothetical protein